MYKYLESGKKTRKQRRKEKKEEEEVESDDHSVTRVEDEKEHIFTVKSGSTKKKTTTAELRKTKNDIIEYKQRIRSSRFYEEVKKDILMKISTFNPELVVVYGIGNIGGNRNARIQFAFLLLLKEELENTRAVGYDPISTKDDIQLYMDHGIDYLEGNLEELDSRTLFYMPHCEAELYEKVIDQSRETKAEILIIGNDFSEYLIKNKIKNIQELIKEIESIDFPDEKKLGKEWSYNNGAFNDTCLIIPSGGVFR